MWYFWPEFWFISKVNAATWWSSVRNPSHKRAQNNRKSSSENGTLTWTLLFFDSTHCFEHDDSTWAFGILLPALFLITRTLKETFIFADHLIPVVTLCAEHRQTEENIRQKLTKSSCCFFKIWFCLNAAILICLFISQGKKNYLINWDSSPNYNLKQRFKMEIRWVRVLG